MTINREHAEALFKREAVLIGEHDVMPLNRAVVLFGQTAVDAARLGDHVNVWAFEGQAVPYLTRAGVLYAATVHNVSEIGINTADAIKAVSKGRG